MPTQKFLERRQAGRNRRSVFDRATILHDFGLSVAAKELMTRNQTQKYFGSPLLNDIVARIDREASHISQEHHMNGLMSRLQNLNLTRLELDEAIELSVGAEMLRGGYKRHQLPAPEWLDDAIRSLDRYIGDRTRDAAEMELRELAQAEAADQTASERKTARAARKAELEAKLKIPAASV
jgi:hypothetical protein